MDHGTFASLVLILISLLTQHGKNPVRYAEVVTNKKKRAKTAS